MACCAASGRLEYQRSPFYANFSYLLGHQKARIFMGKQYRWTAVGRIAAAQRLLEQTAIAIQTEELFWIALAGQGPQPRARTSAQNDGYEGKCAHTIQWVVVFMK